jgi:hypothetical protein
MNMRHWDKLRTPPDSALKPITGGRLKGMTDISPQWRMQAMTEFFGPVGIGWKYEIVSLWHDPGANDEIVAHAKVNLFFKDSTAPDWSAPIPGVGGAMFVASEKAGLHTSDEAFKMAVTDALSVAMKALGMAADVYLGAKDSKYGPKVGEARSSGDPWGKKRATWDRVEKALNSSFGEGGLYDTAIPGSRDKLAVLKAVFGVTQIKVIRAMEDQAFYDAAKEKLMGAIEARLAEKMPKPGEAPAQAEPVDDLPF